MPIAACYRRIKELDGLGLVYCEQELPSRNGKGLQLFRSRLKSVRISLEDGNLRARAEVGPPGVLPAPQGEVTEQTLSLPGALLPAEGVVPIVGFARMAHAPTSIRSAP